MPEVYEFLEAESFKYAIRLPANWVLQDCVAHLLKPPVGRPLNDVRHYYASFSYQAGTGTSPGGSSTRSNSIQAAFARGSTLIRFVAQA